MQTSLKRSQNPAGEKTSAVRSGDLLLLPDAALTALGWWGGTHTRLHVCTDIQL